MAKHHKKIERNQHHLLWTRKTWTGEFAQKLRSAFVVDINWNLHEKLHTEIEPIPVPSESECKKAWLAYQTEREMLAELPPERKVAWLVHQIDDQEFCEAMQRQFEFFITH